MWNMSQGLWTQWRQQANIEIRDISYEALLVKYDDILTTTSELLGRFPGALLDEFTDEDTVDECLRDLANQMAALRPDDAADEPTRDELVDWYWPAKEFLLRVAGTVLKGRGAVPDAVSVQHFLATR